MNRDVERNPVRWRIAIFFWATVLALAPLGCGSRTCKRIARDREEFLARDAKDASTHLEVTLPYAVANALLEPSLAKVKPIPVSAPGLGALASAFGKLRIAPTRAVLQPAAGGLVGLRLDFDVLAGDRGAFGMWLETAFAPEVDLKAGAVTAGFSPESLKKVTPHVTADAAKRLGGMIYDGIPGIARALVSRAAVDKAAGGVVEFLLKQFYALAKDKLLPEVADLAKIRIAMPDVPVRDLALAPTEDAGGALRLSISTALPVGGGLAARDPKAALPGDRISVRATASTLAELANWAMAKGLVPARYNAKGKADEKGEYVAALEWKPGKRPMKIHLWQLEGVCKRVDMGAKAAIGVEDGTLVIEATDGVIEGSEAAPFTELGVFFYALWKDAVKTTIKRSAEMKFSAGGQELSSRVEAAELAGDEVTMTVSLAAPGR
jgi:hypothetical protein